MDGRSSVRMRNIKAAANNLYPCLSNHDMQVSCFSCSCDKIKPGKSIFRKEGYLCHLDRKSLVQECEATDHNRLIVRKQRERWMLVLSLSSLMYSVPDNTQRTVPPVFSVCLPILSSQSRNCLKDSQEYLSSSYFFIPSS